MGSYAESLLTPDERVIRRERQHPIALLLDSWLAIILWGITIVLFIVQLIVPEEVFGRDLFGRGTLIGDLGLAVSFITLLLGILVLAGRWWWWRTQEFIVTNYRLVLAWGVVNKSSSDSSLEKINDAVLQISLLGRLLDYGSLEVLTAAPIQGADMLDRLHHAKDFKKAMMTAKHELLTGASGANDGDNYRRAPARDVEAVEVVPEAVPAAAAGTAPASGADPLKADTPEEVTDLLTELAKLRDAGATSAEEYEAKKTELLGRL
jgi:hypothetical protein